MNRTLRALVALALALPILPAPVEAGDYAAASAVIRYDVDSSTGTSCYMAGANGSPWSQQVNGAQRIKTSGSSTTVSSETASSGAFALAVARDVISIKNPGVETSKAGPFVGGTGAVITVVTDANTVTVDPAVNWAGFSYSWLRPVCGTTAADGWIAVAGADKLVMTVQYEQGDLDALLWNFECMQDTPGSVPNIVYPNEGDTCGSAGTYSSGFCSFATAGTTANLSVETLGSYGQCRFVFKYASTDTSDAGANLERVTATIAKVVLH